jgi:hypothetical protein
LSTGTGGIIADAAGDWQFCQFDERGRDLYDARLTDSRICAVSLVVLIAVAFTRVRDGLPPARTRGAIIDTVAAATPDDVPAWSDRSGRHHHATQLAAFNSGDASPACLHTRFRRWR